MANEILKDEVLSEEQLEEVAGGTRGELSCDTKFLNELGVMKYSVGPGSCQKDMEGVQKEVNRALGKIQALQGYSISVTSLDSSNTYKIGDEEVSRREFYSSVCEALGKPEFNWKQYI